MLDVRLKRKAGKRRMKGERMRMKMRLGSERMTG